jgi:cytidine deaminase
MEEPVLYRGTNMEVSMPTGSLCAERNVIGTALSANPKLKREDLKMIAVLAVPYTPTIPDTIAGGGAGMKRINSTASFTSVGRKISIGSEHEEWVASSSSVTGTTSLLLLPPTPQRPAREDLASSFAMVGLNDTIVDSAGDHGQSTATTVQASNRQQQQQQQSGNNLSSTSVRKISLFSKSTSLPDFIPGKSDSNSNIDGKGSNKKPVSSSQQRDRQEAQQQQRIHHHQYRQYDKRTVVVHPSTDMNPLAPCGACNEWLKKISESNPYFRIVTFTDADCNGVYCSSCQE